MADAKRATWIGCVQEHQAEARAMEARNWKGAAPAVILKFDKGVEELENGDELVLVEVGKVGYARDVKYKEDPANRGRRSADSRQWILSRRGFFKCRNGAQLGYVDCDRCGCTFLTVKGLTQHQAEGRGHCKLYEELMGAQLQGATTIWWR